MPLYLTFARLEAWAAQLWEVVMWWSKFLRVVTWGALGVVAAVAVAGAPPAAALNSPCGGSGQSPISNGAPGASGAQTYCQSGFGWSDTWFPTENPGTGPTAYANNLGFDVFSGNDAAGLFSSHISPGTGSAPANYNLFTGTLDANPPTLGTITSNTPWTLNGLAPIGDSGVAGDVKVTGNTATSSIVASTTDGGSIEVDLLTTVLANGEVQFTYTITNKNVPLGMDTGNIPDFEFIDYFNFHPYGSNTGVSLNSYNCAQASFDSTTGTLSIDGGSTAQNNCTTAPLVANGSISANKPVIGCDIDLVPTTSPSTNVGNVLNELAGLSTTPLTGNDCGAGGTGSVLGDYAGALVWDLGSLDAGDSTSITITKDTELPPPPPPPQVPEPASLALFGTAIIGLAAFSRRKRVVTRK